MEGGSDSEWCPKDLVGVLATTALVWVVIGIPYDFVSPVRVLAGGIFLLVAVGYGIVSALFPAKSDPITGVERMILAVLLSVVTVPGTGFLIHLLPVPLKLGVVLVSVTVVTVLATGVAWYRRGMLPLQDRYRAFEGSFELTVPDRLQSGDVATLTVLTASIVVVVGAIGHLAVAPQPDDTFSTMSLHVENETGELTTAYPETLSTDEQQPYVVTVSNREGERINYTVLVVVQRLEDGTVASQYISDSTTRVVDPGEDWRTNVTVRPEAQDERLELVFLLYTGSPPESPTIENAHRWTAQRVTTTGTEAVVDRTNAIRRYKQLLILRKSWNQQ